MNRQSEFKFIRMWPRAVFDQKDGNRLIIADEKVLQDPGVYILYRQDEPYYVGQAECLFDRLHSHANKMTDRYYFHWDFFSAFSFASGSEATKRRIGDLEGILIAALPKLVNSSTPRWPKHKIPKPIRDSLKKAQARAMGAKAGG